MENLDHNITWSTVNLVTKSNNFTAIYHENGKDYEFEVTGYWVRDEGWEVLEIAWLEEPEDFKTAEAQIEKEFLSKMGGSIRMLRYSEE